MKFLKILMFLTLSLFLINLVDSAEINFFSGLEIENRNISQWTEYDTITNNEELEAQMGINFIINNISKVTRENLTFIIDPFFDMYYDNIELEYINLSICDGRLRKPFFEIYEVCYKSYINYTLEKFSYNLNDKNYPEYKYIFKSKDFKDGVYYTLILRYKLKNFAIKEGNYRILFIKDQFHHYDRGLQRDKTVILPKNSLLERFPEDSFVKLLPSNQWAIFIYFPKMDNMVVYTDKSFLAKNKDILWSIIFGVIFLIIGFFLGRKDIKKILKLLEKIHKKDGRRNKKRN